MYTKKLQLILRYTITLLHILLVTAMVVIGLLSLFRPDIMRGVIDFMGIQIKSW